MIKRADRYLVNGMPSDTMLRSVLQEHMQNLPRLNRLGNYYRGESDITGRERAKGASEQQNSASICAIYCVCCYRLPHRAAGFVFG